MTDDWKSKRRDVITRVFEKGSDIPPTWEE